MSFSQFVQSCWASTGEEIQEASFLQAKFFSLFALSKARQSKVMVEATYEEAKSIQNSAEDQSNEIRQDAAKSLVQSIVTGIQAAFVTATTVITAKAVNKLEEFKSRADTFLGRIRNRQPVQVALGREQPSDMIRNELTSLSRRNFENLPEGINAGPHVADAPRSPTEEAIDTAQEHQVRPIFNRVEAAKNRLENHIDRKIRGLQMWDTRFNVLSQIATSGASSYYDGKKAEFELSKGGHDALKTVFSGLASLLNSLNQVTEQMKGSVAELMANFVRVAESLSNSNAIRG